MGFNELVEMIGTRATKKLAGNTYARMDEDGTVIIRYHSTDIARITADTVTLESGGWRTSTTKERMNSYALPYGWQISQAKGIWYLYRWSPVEREDGLHSPRVRYEDGMTINTLTGEIVGTLPNEDTTARDEANKETTRAIAKYVKLYTDEKLSELLEMLKDGRAKGDCFVCQFGMGGNDHFLSHIEEQYIMGTLVWNALKERGYLFPDVIMSVAPDQARRTVTKYLKKRLLVGVAV